MLLLFLYRYFSLFSSCKPKAQEKGDHKDLSYVEAALGYEYAKTGIAVNFLDETSTRTECELTIDSFSAIKLRQAISAQYWYQLDVDGLPVWGPVGERVRMTESTVTNTNTNTNTNGNENNENNNNNNNNNNVAKHVESFIYTHRELRIGYDGEHITEVLVTPSGLTKVDLTGDTIKLTYNVSWFKSALGYTDRAKYYQDRGFFEHKVHRYATVNSAALSLFLFCIVWAVLGRITGSDDNSSSSSHHHHHHKGPEADLEAQLPVNSPLSASPIIGDGEEGWGAWRRLAGDVFRGAESLGLFCALIGAGAQLLYTVAAVVLGSVFNGSTVLNVGNSLAGRALVWYALLSTVNGFVSGRYYQTAGGKAWMRAGLVTAALFPTVGGLLWTLASIAAWGSGAAVGASFGAWAEGGLLWVFCLLPLTYLGIVVGRSVAINRPAQSSASAASAAAAAARAGPLPGIVPPKMWYERAPFVFFVSGVLPFGAVAVELYYLFAALWNYKVYYTFGYALAGLAAFVVVCGCVAVLAVYYTLCAEDYRWQWVSLYPGFASALYTLLYALYYYTAHTAMIGFLQTAIFYAISLALAAVLGLVGAFVGFTSASWFVGKIYTPKKTD